MRKTFCVILLVLAALLSIPAVVVIWLQRDVVSVDGYTAAARGIIAEPHVQDDIADRVTNAVMNTLPIESMVDSAAGELPPRLGELMDKISPALDGAVNDYVSNASTSFVHSPQFEAVWTLINRIAHQAVLRLLHGEGDSVTLDLAPVVQEVKARLLQHGFELANEIPEVHLQYELVTVPQIAKARNLYSTCQVLLWLLPLLVLLCLVGGVILAPDRWQGIMWAAVGIALAMGVTGALTWIMQAQISDGRVVYDAFVAPLHSLLRWVFLIAVVVVAVAYLIPYRSRHNNLPNDRAEAH
jgi:hypothetical protein